MIQQTGFALDLNTVTALVIVPVSMGPVLISFAVLFISKLADCIS